jgi:hypothetical protein
MAIKVTIIIIDEDHSYQPYKILSNIFLSRTTPNIDEIIVDHYQCGVRRNRSTTDHRSDIHHSSNTVEKVGVYLDI